MMKMLKSKDIQIKMYCKIKNGIKKLMNNEEGMGMVEIALIIIIIIALGLTFKKAINDFLLDIFSNFDMTGY